MTKPDSREMSAAQKRAATNKEREDNILARGLVTTLQLLLVELHR